MGPRACRRQAAGDTVSRALERFVERQFLAGNRCQHALTASLALMSPHHFAVLVASATFILIIAGGLVTSTGSGLAVPDWPTTYGRFMFAFPFSKMVGGIYYEHAHRLIAASVGILMIVLAIWLWWQEPRRSVRRLGLAALGVVVLQGVLGGITVIYLLPAPVSIAHAGLAQIFFCLTVTLALFTSPGWRAGYTREFQHSRPDPREVVDDRLLPGLLAATSGLISAQILLGATMRHLGAGLAIPDFPLAFGRVVPQTWSPPVAIHFAHRAGALVDALAILGIAAYIRRYHASRRELTRPVTFLAGLVAIQIALGGLTVLSGRAVVINTAHVATGALVLATSLVLTFRAYRPGWSHESDVAGGPVHSTAFEGSSVGAKA